MGGKQIGVSLSQSHYRFVSKVTVTGSIKRQIPSSKGYYNGTRVDNDMVLFSFFLYMTLHSLDNSEWMRNGDYVPTRMEAQHDAGNVISLMKLHNFLFSKFIMRG